MIMSRIEYGFKLNFAVGRLVLAIFIDDLLDILPIAS
jgi:hypothetical protein